MKLTSASKSHIMLISLSFFNFLLMAHFFLGPSPKTKKKWFTEQNFRINLPGQDLHFRGQDLSYIKSSSS